MKKQILFLAMFTLALIFAGTNKGFGQAVHYSAPRPLDCPADALHPIAGQNWTYEANASVSGTFHFWATKDPSFISATALQNGSAGLLTSPGDLLYASASYDTPGATASVDINWSTDVLANTDYQGTPDITGATPSPTFVAVYFAADDGCSDNFKVWELDPLVGFTVDVLAIGADDVTVVPDFAVVPTSCLDNVESASYSGGQVVFDYGENFMYFEFVAANFSGSWTPTFGITGLLGAQAVTSVEYTYDLPTTWGGTTTWTTLESGVTSVSTTETNTQNGVSIFVRVLIDHNDFEGINGQTLTLTLDGQNAAGEWDVVNTGTSDTCVDPGAADQNDTADNGFKLRPAITDPTMPVPNLIPGNSVN